MAVKNWLVNINRKVTGGMTRVLPLGDLHCGHQVGFTPADWDTKPPEGYGTRKYEFWRHRREIYDFVVPLTVELSADITLFNGDLVEGKGHFSGATELLTADRVEQTDMAVGAIEDLTQHNPEILATYGTPAHSGVQEDWEDEVVKKSRSGGRDGIRKIGSEDDIKLYGKVINYKHHAGRSSIPHGKGTPLAKERLWNVMWAIRDEYPLADVLLRHHNHYFTFIGEAGWLAVSCPALQGYGTKYGQRRVLGTVDTGVFWLDIYKDGTIKWDFRIKRFYRKNQFALVVK